MDQHPTPQELRAFAEGELPKDGARVVVSHFLRGCRACRTEAAALLNLIRIRQGPRETTPERVQAYDQAFDRVLEVLEAGRAPREAPAAVESAHPAWLQTLAGVPHHLRGPELIASLLQRAWSLRHQRPAEMVKVARLAVLTSGALSPDEHGAGPVADLQCEAWSALGNAYRVTGDVAQAQEALDRAASLLEGGSGDPLLRARLFDFQASLESTRGRYDRALMALDVVVSIYREQGDQHLEGRALVSKGLQAGYAGRPRQALRFTREGLALLDQQREPELVLNALHNQLWFLLESGRTREARRFLESHRERLAAGETQRVDLLWLEGRIAGALGDLDTALALLEEAHRSFGMSELPHKAANVTIDLAALAIRQGQPARARALIRSAEDAFRDLAAPKSTLVALSFLHRRLMDREVPVHLVIRLADLVRRGMATPPS
jgi:tetratricopeptide (TPR) repeat protein